MMLIYWLNHRLKKIMLPSAKARDQNCATMKPKRTFVWTSCILVICAQAAFCSSSDDNLVSSIDFSHAIVYQAVSHSEYFGFTVALLMDKSTSWILVGAPIAANNSNFKSNDEFPGKVYACRLLEGCTEIHVQPENYESMIKSPFIYEKNDHALLGSSLDVYGNVILICAPKSAVLQNGTLTKNNTENSYRLFGACFAGNSGVNGTFNKLTNLRGPNTLYIPFGIQKKDHAYYIYGQAGFSGIVTHTNGLLLGAPGLFASSGGSMEYNNKFEKPTIKTPMDRFKDTNIPLSASLGYAVTTGKYFKDDRIYYYAASAPRAVLKEPSQVIIFKQGNWNKTVITSIKNNDQKDGVQPGDYFGYSLASGDFNGDGRDEIIIGSPFYSSSTAIDQGRVFIFRQASTFQKMEKWAKLPGDEEQVDAGARFGLSVASLLNIYSDKFCGFAVAAPFAHGGGAVYIYKGGAYPKLMKKITGHHFYPSIQGFGYSFSRPVDVDDNNVADLAIGAYKSGHVVLLRSRPVADINMELIWSVGDFLSLDTRNIQVTLRMLLNCSKKVENTEVHLTMSLSPNSWKFAETKKSTFAAQINISREWTSTFFNLTGNITDYDNEPQPLRLEAEIVVPKEEESHLIIDSKGKSINGSDTFSKFKPIFTKQSYIIKDERPYKPSCNDSCNTKYTMKMRFGTSGQKIYREDTTSIPVHLSITSQGDRVRAELRLSVQTKGVQFKFNALTEDHFVINMGLSQNKSYKFSLEVNEESMLDEIDEISVTAHVTPKQLGNVTKDASIKESVKLFSNASVSISGYTERSYNYKKEDKNVTLNYYFEVEKKGQSPLREVRIAFDIPVVYENYKFAIFTDPTAKKEGSSEYNAPIECIRKDLISKTTKYNDYQRVLRTNNKSTILDVNRTLEISCAEKHWKCVTLECDVSKFLVKTARIVEIQLQINFTSPKIDNKKFTLLFGVHARIDLIKPAKREPALKNTTLKVTLFAIVNRQIAEKIELWIIIAAIVSAIATLLSLVTILKRVGFFKREKKVELNALKRQTASIMPILADESVAMTPEEASLKQD